VLANQDFGTLQHMCNSLTINKAILILELMLILTKQIIQLNIWTEIKKMTWVVKLKNI